MNSFADIFNGTPTSIPLPNVPKDFPSIILSDSEEKIKIEVSESRTNIYRFRKENEPDFDEKAFVDLSMSVVEKYITFTNASVGRLAVVSNKFVSSDNPGLFLAKHFCKEKWIKEPFNRPENFELHAHKKYTFDKFKVNSWVRCKTGSLKDGSPIILVLQDINTLAEEIESNNFVMDDVKKFVNSAILEQTNILGKYFPKE
ncbi:MAG: hypothetical protein NT145_01980 [Elusimicrobia bacterium]|nr:hypothetical protein [Elusimicrobiota bacterium]